MGFTFRDDVHIEKGTILNGQFTPAFVFSWADDEHGNRVRVQADDKLVGAWGVNWMREREVEKAFRDRRDTWLVDIPHVIGGGRTMVSIGARS